MRDPLKENARLICRVGRLAYQKGYVAANDGNISVRLPDKSILITPSGVSKGRMLPEQMVNLRPENDWYLRSGTVPSSETEMHKALYEADSTIGAVVHLHAPRSVCFSARGPGARWPALCADIILQVGYVPVVPYLPLGSRELARAVALHADSSCVVLLQNHGLTAWGKDLWQAFDRAEAVEHYFRVLALYEQAGSAGKLLCPEELAALDALRLARGESRGKGPWATAAGVRP